MPFDDRYRRQVSLLIQVLPLVAAETCFALKGGTAINLFVRDMPRLSVDIDLAFLPVKDRAASLADIKAAMQRIAERIRAGIPRTNVLESKLEGEDCVNKLVARAGRIQVKIEVTPVMRGCVYAPETRAVRPRVEAEFGFAEIQVVSFADLYGGKLVAALDRQHPRDLFDVRDLLANEGITPDLRAAFVIYLVSGSRSFSEILAPTRLDISAPFLRDFSGMTESPVTRDELVKARENLIAGIVGEMPGPHREFLRTFKRGAPDWRLLGLKGAEELPAVKWRLVNLAKIDPGKRELLLDKLEKALSGTGSR